MARNRITVTVERPGGSDRFGTPLPGTSHVVERCLVTPRSSDEKTDGRATVVTGMSLHGPPGADINAQDVIVLNKAPQPSDDRWQVAGEPGRWPSTTEVVLTRAEG